ncbi:MAG: Rne/Rng family ribonuclease [Planctomycetota bacterium]
MEKIMLVNVVEQEEVRIALLEDSKLEQLYLERTSREHIVGNIHKGIVVNIVPNIEAAFIEFGYKKHGFLHVSDILPSAVGKKGRSGNIRRLLSEGQELLVQVTKEGIGDKGPSLTTYLSLPGRYLVLMPGLSRRGVSRRIKQDKERDRLRQLLRELDIPNDMGVIARTAAEGRNKGDLKRDLDYLQRLWHAISQRAERSKAPAMVYQESDPVTRVIRDVFTEDIRKIVVDSEEVHEKVRDFLRSVLPKHARKVKQHDASDPLFHHYGVEQEIEQMHSRRVELPSGGSIILEQTEALVAIDVNSGTYKGRGDAEETAYQINLEAAPEIARQVRLRDLGGVIVMDFIDMEQKKHRTEVEEKLWEALKRDRARLRMLKMSPFCIVEMTRQRQRRSLKQSTYEECPACRGTGLVKGRQTLALQVLREIKAGLDGKNLERVEVRMAPDAANYLNNEMRQRVRELEQASGAEVGILADSTVAPGEHNIRFLNPDGHEVTL